MSDNILLDENARKEKKATWQAPELLDLSVTSTAGNKDAIATVEGTGGYQNKLDVSPS
tara:strand:- start:1661 stop:1834 length:174 start_codon:yes stop_codon:yes gene_type:complete